jgi:ACS family allantoate permease-like MFS transporter
MWEAKYSPRNTVPWAVILACYIACPFIMLAIGWGLRKENLRREALPNGGHDESFGYIDEVQADGTVVSKKVDIA